MKLGILSAMPQEMNSIRSLISDCETEKFAGREYYKGKVGTIDVVLTFSQCGKVAAASAASILIIKYGIDKLIFTGVAGAANDELSIGDIVISDKTYQHDMDATPLFKKHEVPLTEKIYFPADSELMAVTKKGISNFKLKFDQLMPAEVIDAFDLKMNYITGTIASGDQFISSVKRRQSIVSEKPETLAIEMEGAAVGQICSEHDIPFVVIRTISDSANEKASIDFPRFLDEVASKYATHIIKETINVLNS